jgi:hypothetical protein
MLLNSQLEFRVTGQGDQYVDLSRTLFNVKVKIVKQGGSAYAATDAIGPSNNLFDTMFSDVKVEFNQKKFQIQETCTITERTWKIYSILIILPKTRTKPLLYGFKMILAC